MTLYFVLRIIVFSVLLGISMAPSPAPAQSAELVASDFDGSGRVDFADFLDFAENFGRSFSQDNFDSRFDLDRSSIVDFGDFLIFANNFGKLTSGETETFLYIADFFSNRVQVVNTSTNLTIPSRAFTVTFPRGLAFGQQTGLVYVASTDTLFAYTDSGQQQFFVELTPFQQPVTGLLQPPGGFKVAINNDETRAFVSEDAAGIVEIIDLTNRVPLAQIAVGLLPGALTLSSDESELYVVRRTASIAVVDVVTQTVIDSIITGTLATSRIAASPDKSRLYTMTSRPDAAHTSGTAVNILRIDPAKRSVLDSVLISREEDLVAQPIDISTAADGSLVYASINRTDPGPAADFTALIQVGALIVVDTNSFSIRSEISELQLIFGFGIAEDGATGYFSGVENLTEGTFRVFVVDMVQGKLIDQLPVALNSGTEFLFTNAKEALRSAIGYIELAFSL
ncbi:MAG: hypothetical protein VX910_07205 [Candidatus Latescibacterota bacterium]|nr:hypothetical protein [Candidatus Latescibacterota bacterium]